MTYKLCKLFLLSDEKNSSKYSDSRQNKSLARKSDISIRDEKKHLDKRSISDFLKSPANEPNTKTNKRRLTKIRFIKVKEIHPDAPEPRVILKNEQRKPESAKKNIIKPKGI